MAEFAYNNVKNASIGNTSFKLNCDYHSRISYEKNINLCSKSKSTNELSTDPQELMTMYKKNLYHAQEL